MKKPSRKTLKKKLWTLFSLYIRYRDGIRTTGCKDWIFCITCGKRYHYKLMQAGHFVAGRHNAGLFSEKGVHAQCYNCNINLKGNTLVYRRKIIELYGEGFDEILEREASHNKQFEIDELEAMIILYKMKIKQFEAGVELPKMTEEIK